ncbi:hypothetical protein A2619_05830 [candidate division WWE3 bacterium RIFOXYD1_FULL_39_9]|uniref:Uncharacterized protein n=1 Tax=candidate division WWE3 bacterium RIFOXYD1_FULL_39_9 TaxID=1802649 RepID=A0A1F4X3Q0_UNCKA|nr:MAG: hypothetical protein A2619_05830 [candidate division WWE3 bacterium RIFOXYD1_FULL_39_9]
MRLGELVIRLRETTQLFQGRVGGTAEYAIAQDNTLNNEMAFVLPVTDVADENKNDTSIQQIITEQFAVIVAIKNDTNFKDKTGFTAYNRLHEIRKDMFRAYLGYDTGLLFEEDDENTTETLIYYRGGQLLDIDRGYLWYQFTFEYKVGITTQTVFDPVTGYLDRIYAQWVLAESDNLPVTEDLPVESFAPDMEQMIDLQVLRES